MEQKKHAGGRPMTLEAVRAKDHGITRRTFMANGLDRRHTPLALQCRLNDIARNQRRKRASA
jgi:hypothetical protein